MRKVYNPPKPSGDWSWRILGTGLITLGVFLVLPLTQMLSRFAQRELYVTKTDTATLEAPPPEVEPPPPPPVEEPEEEPPPELTDIAQPINLNVDLDLAVGDGGALPMGLFGGDDGGAMENLNDALDMADLDKPPQLVASVPPTYPPDLRRAKVEGTVTLLFVLGENGRVEDPRVESSSRAEFEKPALDAVRRWRFKPGMKDGEPVRTYMRLPIAFRVQS